MRIQEVLEYEDVSLTQQFSTIDSRNDIDTSSLFSRNIKINLPICSAPMASITNSEMAIAMAKSGAIGVIHRFQEHQDDEIRKVRSAGAIAIGSIGVNNDPIAQAELLHEAGALGVVIDVAHGGMESIRDLIFKLKNSIPSLDIIAGNVMTGELARDLEWVGADAIRVGIGPGAACTTRNKTGVGGGQLTAVYECAKAVSIPVIADGGIKEYGDILKALAAGASSVMIGRMFAGCPEVEPEERIFYRGSAWPHEGEEGRILPHPVSARTILSEMEVALRSGMSYLGARTVADLPSKAVFRKRVK